MLLIQVSVWKKKVEGMFERRTRKIFMPHETFIIFFFKKEEIKEKSKKNLSSISYALVHKS